ncbi:50S ribosomal protein L22 [Candidatus Falkowbacteria bacterium]|jgi:large subunit ribosomal protein L22|nr:50S ribosomal protein L22 [Candidatus Falkowbacteria bacterium]MBT5502992.1 50S ribosomal protein L22 [Candidatus Falkowbacteria bacterium]MBT6574348.1 50S ribosomal protein L22 [Candidatus Falkowbacteria bacterium]MBT7349059.1 50S ribosomal protein L22 [Candidatus Falkowbacteria bacterium]MBT7500947.1 50S ribosomal protein L22 [Candidatus Falkowbacteria bacterium]
MQVKAKAKYIRISPRKARLVVDLVRGLDLQAALDKLAVTNKKAVRFVDKLLKSALANAEHNLELKKDNLYIKELKVDEGPTFYRWMPRAFGRATPLRKRTSMISVILDERVPTEKKVTEKGSKKIETVKVDQKTTDQIKQKVDVSKKDTDLKDVDAEKKDDQHDVKRKGGQRDMQQQDRMQKKEKGLFKKMFRRKSGM